MNSFRTQSFKVVLFDLDGTLIEFKFKVIESRKAVIDMLQGRGFDTKELTPEMRTQNLLNETRRQIENSSRLGSFEEMKEEISKVLDRFEIQAFNEARVHPGSLPILKKITSKGIRAAVVTNSGRVPVDLLLENFGFSPYLSLIVTRNEVERLKPDPQGILRALEALQARREDSIYVGDSIIDVQAARAAKVSSVAVASGLYKAEELMEHGPDFLIQRIEELEGIVFPSISSSANKL